MAGFKQPTFQDRAAAAADAKSKAQALLAKRASIDPEAAAQKQAAREAREAKERERNAARKAAADQAKAEKAEAALAAQAAKAAEAAPKPMLSEAERKALRDARYAARKART